MSAIGQILLVMGAMCPKCGYGTRSTSKRWAICKHCGLKVRRFSKAQIDAMARHVQLCRSLATAPLGPKAVRR